MPKSGAAISTRKKSLPINLLKKLRREQRIRNGGVGRNRKRNARKRQVRRKSQQFETSELEALIHASEMQLKEILANEQLLSDIPYDVTPDELQGEISLAQGGGTTIYIQRDGLSTLTVVLPQEEPTIAQLKRTIEAQARAQLNRELRERHEERQRRRHNAMCSPARREPPDDVKRTRESSVEYKKSVHLTGELVCSATHNGHQHRPNVSWRFLWRSYALYNLATQSLVNDENGRKLLSECCIENAQTLKFTKREKYLGKKRQ